MRFSIFSDALGFSLLSLYVNPVLQYAYNPYLACPHVTSPIYVNFRPTVLASSFCSPNPGLQNRSIFNRVHVRVREIFARPSSSVRVLKILFFEFKFEFGKNDRVQVRVHCPGLYRSQWHEQINDMLLFLG